jgi:HTH-type transcriptional regulator/antitoxin HigA
MEFRPLRTEGNYEAALKEIENLWGSPYGSSEGDRMEVLVPLVEAYEEKHYPIEPPDPIEAILHQMESQGLNRRDLEPLLGSRGRVSEILNRKRPLSIEMIRNLHAGLGISADVLVQPYELRRA